METEQAQPREDGERVGCGAGRKDAVARGLPRYFSGKPCRHGHIAERVTASRTCVECARAIHKRFRDKDPEACRADNRARNQKMWATRGDYHALSYAKHRDAIRARLAKWLAAHPGAKNAYNARRRHRAARATPWWLTDAQLAEIRSFYDDAARRGAGWSVDHIVPLQGKTVCGLHVPWNLRVITGTENQSKGAKLLPELIAA